MARENPLAPPAKYERFILMGFRAWRAAAKLRAEQAHAVGRVQPEPASISVGVEPKPVIVASVPWQVRREGWMGSRMQDPSEDGLSIGPGPAQLEPGQRYVPWINVVYDSAKEADDATKIISRALDGVVGLRIVKERETWRRRLDRSPPWLVTSAKVLESCAGLSMGPDHEERSPWQPWIEIDYETEGAAKAATELVREALKNADTIEVVRLATARR
jgi:hypothetical protein